MTDLPVPPVLSRMLFLVNQWRNRSDNRWIFLNCYALMTQNMLDAIEAEVFHDPLWVNVLLHRLVDYYFEALDAYEAGRPEVPAVWRRAHDAAQLPRTHVLQNLLLGANAHITYDLAFTLVDLLQPEWGQLPATLRRQRYEDHRCVNEVIGRTIDTIQEELLEEVEPALDLIDMLCGPMDEWLVSRLLTEWRDQVWKQAISLVTCAESADRDKICRQVERIALQRANRIMFRKDSDKR